MKLIPYFIALSIFSIGCGFLKHRDVNYTTKVEIIDSGAKVKCFVYDKHTSTPLEGTLIKIRDTKKFGLAKNDGSVDFDLPPGKYELIIQYGHFSTSIRNINVNARKQIIITSYINLPYIE